MLVTPPIDANSRIHPTASACPGGVRRSRMRRAVSSMYPEGAAMKANQIPLTALTPSPDFTLVAKANRCYAERVESGADLPAALERAIRHIETTRTQALLDIAIAA